MNRLLFVLFCFVSISLTSQVTIILENAGEFPDSIRNDLYVSGNFNNWDPGIPAYHLTNADGKWSVSFTPDTGTLYVEFKFTRGDWSTGEVMKDGGFKTNRSYYYKPGLILHETVESFQDIAPKKQIEANEDVIQFKVYSNELKAEKNIRVYLPCDYMENTQKRYPVIYMLDGQNLFDDTYAYSGEWGVDENMDSICMMVDYDAAIIVGIDHAGAERFTEYSPWELEGYGGGKGDEFADFVAITLKPVIDSAYRTLTGREFTAVAGSSMGGLESLFIVLNHPETFSKGGIFSPAFWTSEGNFENALQYHSELPVKLYFVCGAMEGDDAKYMKDMERMYDILLAKRIQNLELRLVVESDGTHSEKFWRSEFIDCYLWLFGE